jgi:hypothetical protein
MIDFQQCALDRNYAGSPSSDPTTLYYGETQDEHCSKFCDQSYLQTYQDAEIALLETAAGDACEEYESDLVAATTACTAAGDCTAVDAAAATAVIEQKAADAFKFLESSTATPAVIDTTQASGGDSSAKNVQLTASLVGVAVLAWIM